MDDQQRHELKSANTERELHARNLAISEEAIRNLFENVAVGICHLSLEGKFIRVNRQLCTISGYPRETLEKMTLQEITHPPDLERITELTEKLLMEGGQASVSEKRCIRKDGSLIWCRLTMSLVLSAQGEPAYFISTVTDINDQKMAELEFKERAKELESFNILMIDREMRIIELKKEVNQLCKELDKPIRFPEEWE